MRGISEQISIALGDSVYIFEPGMDNRGLSSTGVHAIANLSELKTNKKLPYEIKIKLKGSQSLNFIPLGKTTRVDLKANWSTPSLQAIICLITGMSQKKISRLNGRF